MTSSALTLLVPLLGVTFGYEPSSDADVGYDYIVQVEPEMVEQMHRGNADSIEVNIPREVAPIRRIRVVVGSDSLPKKLRPGATTYAAHRPDLDSLTEDDLDAASIGLLAQTGPAGGYGRNATGFNGAATRPASPPPSSGSISVPSINNNYNQPTAAGTTQEFRSSLDASFQAAETGITNTQNAMQGAMNDMAAAGQSMIDSTQRSLNNVVAPPDYRAIDSQLPPPPNTGTQPGARVAQGQPQPTATATTPPPNWNQPAGNSVGNAGVQPNERSVLANPNTATNPNRASTTMTQAEQDYWNRVRLDQQKREQDLREQQLREAEARLAKENAANTSLNGPQFPSQPRLQALPDRQNGEVVQPLVDRSLLNTVDNRQPASLQPPAISSNTSTGAAMGAFDDPFFKPLEKTETSTTMQASTIPAIGTASGSTTQTAGRPNVESWSPTDGEQKQSGSNRQPASSGGLPGGVLAWAIALGLLVVNLFQWLNLVDMRNKYRVALRRNSPNLARSMAA